jgi:hypothetical protein
MARLPLDRADASVLAMIAIYSVLVLWAALVLAAAVRLFLWVAFA